MTKTIETGERQVLHLKGWGYYGGIKVVTPEGSGHTAAALYLREDGSWTKDSPKFFESADAAQQAIANSQPPPAWKCEFPGCKVCPK